jgi:hypothetical protein
MEDIISTCMTSADKRIPLSIEAAEELLNLESAIAQARKAVCRKCPAMKVSLSIEGEKTREYHLNVFECAKLKMGIDHQQWRTDNPFR